MDRDAYPDDMARFLRLSDADVERIFRGLPPVADEDLRDLAGFLADAAQTLSRPPVGEARATHLSLLAGAIRTSSAGPEVSSGPAAAALPVTTLPTERRGRRRSPVARWAAKVAVAAATMVAATAALAWAGVDLPGTAAETAFQKVLGVELPNQGHDAPDPEQLPDAASETAGRVLTTIQEWRSGAEGSGCEFGAAVSAAARGLEGEPDTSHCEHTGGNGGPPEAGAARGAGNASHAGAGLETAGEASGGAATEGAAHAENGLGTAGEASGGEGPDNAAEGLGTADEASGGRSGGAAAPGSH
jgi:hypothetical protein